MLRLDPHYRPLLNTTPSRTAVVPPPDFLIPAEWRRQNAVKWQSRPGSEVVNERPQNCQAGPIIRRMAGELESWKEDVDGESCAKTLQPVP